MKAIPCKELYLQCSILFLAATVRLYRLEENSLWLDEAWVSVGILEQLGPATSPLGILGVFRALVFYVSSYLDLYNPYQLRLISVCFGALTPVMVFAICRGFCNPIFSWLGGVCVALLPLLITYSQDFSVYSFAVFISVFSFYFFMKWGYGFNVVHLICFSLLALIGINSSPQLVFFFFALFFWVMLASYMSLRARCLSLLLFILITSLSAFAVVRGFSVVDQKGDVHASVALKLVDKITTLNLTTLGHYFDGYMTSVFNIPNVVSLYSPAIGPGTDGNNPVVLRIVVCLVSLLAIAYFLVRKNLILSALGIAILVFSLATGIGMFVSGQLYERYLLCMQPFFIILIMAFFQAMSKGMLSRVTLCCVSVLYVLYMGCISYQSAYNPRWKPPHDMAFAEIKHRIGDGVLSYCIVPYYFEWPLAKYYLKGVSGITLVDGSYNFYDDLDGAVLMPGQQYVQLASNQVNELKNKKVERIYVYTQRGKDMLDSISAILSESYTKKLIFDSEGIIVFVYDLI